MPNLGILLFAAITVSPAGASMPPKANRVFIAGGGTPPYDFALVTNASGASLAGSSYTSGAKGDVEDVIRVTDGAGESTSVSVIVGPGVTIVPSGVTLPPRGSYVFTVRGGSPTGGYQWSVDGAGTIDNGGRYVAASGGSATIRATDVLGNTNVAQITLGPNVAIAPAEVSVLTGESLTFAGSGGSGAYSFALQTSASGGGIDPVTGVYTAGTTSEVDDVVVLEDNLGNSIAGTVHVRTRPSPSPSPSPVETAPETSPDTAPPSPSATTATGVPRYSVNIAGGGNADNACDCRLVGAPRHRSASALLLAVTAGLVLVARRRRLV